MSISTSMSNDSEPGFIEKWKYAGIILTTAIWYEFPYTEILLTDRPTQWLSPFH